MFDDSLAATRRRYISELTGGPDGLNHVVTWNRDIKYWEDQIAIDLGLSTKEWKDLSDSERISRMEDGLRRRHANQAGQDQGTTRGAGEQDEVAESPSRTGKRRRRRGAPRKAGDEKQHNRMFDAYEQHKSYPKLPRDFNVESSEARRIVKMVRERRRRAKKLK